MRILIATDGSRFSDLAIKKACEFVGRGDVEFKIVSAYEPALPPAIEPAFVSPEYYQTVEEDLVEIAKQNVANAAERVKQHFASHDVNVSAEVLRGFPDQMIIDEAKKWNADLIVVGSHGRGFWGRLLGSVSTGVVHHAPCSVLVVREQH